MRNLTQRNCPVDLHLHYGYTLFSHSSASQEYRQLLNQLSFTVLSQGPKQYPMLTATENSLELGLHENPFSICLRLFLNVHTYTHTRVKTERPWTTQNPRLFQKEYSGKGVDL